MRILLVLSAVIVLMLIVLACMFSSVLFDISPQDASDLVPRRVTLEAENNAFTYFCEATNHMYSLKDYSDVIAPILSGKTNDPATVMLYVEKNAKMFELIKKGLECQTYQAPEVKSFAALLPYIAKGREQARLMALKSVHERANGCYESSAQTCSDIMKMGDMIQKDGNTLIGYLVGIAILQIGTQQAGSLIKEQKLPDVELERLAKALDAIGPFNEGLINAMKVEYVGGCLAFDEVFTNNVENISDAFGVDSEKGKKIGWVNNRYMYHPERTKMLEAEYLRKMISLSHKPFCDLDVSENDIPGCGEDKRKMFLMPNAVGKILLQMLLPALNKTHEKRCFIEHQVSSLKLAVACKLYERKNGKLPANLDELVPSFLPQVPRDPFDGKPMRYNAEKRMIWSVGKDLKDSGGSAQKNGKEVEKMTDADDYVIQI